MEAQKPKYSQGKKKVKKTKFKNIDGTLKECSYETLPQEVESLQVSDFEEGSCSRTECVTDIEVALSEAFREECEEESVRLLDSQGRENLATPLPVEEESNELEVKQTELENYIQNSEFKQCYPSSDTELNELESSTNVPSTSSLADTNFESPIHLSASPSVEPAEDPLELWMKQMEDLEIANEATPSAPSLQPGCCVAVGSEACEVDGQVLVNKPFFPLAEKEEEVCSDLKPFTLSQLATLYQNSELEAEGEFVAQFVETELHGGDVLRHSLYELLINYQRAKAKISVNTVELNGLKQQCKELKNQLWTMEKCSVTERGECQDGNPVEATHEFQTAHYNKAPASNLSRCLCSIRDLTSESFALNAYTSQIFKLQVDNFIQQLEAELSFLPHNSLVNLVPETLPSSSSETGKDLYSVIKELRQAVSVLFHFQRRPVQDEEFLADTRLWLTRLVALLLRVATWREHLFLLHHVLRCPAGVSKWATSFIQPPVAPHNDPFSSHHLDHLVTCLASILLPVKERDVFLTQMIVSTDSMPAGADTEAAWVLVDSDGEDEADTNNLREDDIVSLLNQVPFDSIFRQVLNITQRDERNVHHKQMITDNQLLRLIAFSTCVIGLLEQGLANHGSVRYRQFAKRLGRLVRHTMQYTTDQWTIFRLEGQGRDAAMMERLAVEYDALLSRAVSVLYFSPERTTWQFLAVLPFDSVSINKLWKLFTYLLLGDDDPVDETTWNQRLEEHLGGLSDAEIYYLLTAINTMALSRTEKDWNFIQATTLQLLEIGFLNSTTKDSCYKSARIMLANLTIKYPSLITDILNRLNNNPNCGKLCIYLVKELPIAKWHPTSTDLMNLERWLLETNISSVKHALARYIISGLNLGYSTNDLSHELFLPRSVHIHLAIIVLKTAVQFCPQCPPEGNAITDTVKQMASLAALMTRPCSSDQAVAIWVWQTAYKLKLHLLDQSDASVRQTLTNPVAGFSAVPDMDSASQEAEIISKHLKFHQAMAVYMCLQITALGHSVPLICSRGFMMLSVLQSCQLFTPIISSLQHLVPLFLECPKTLVESDKFRSTILSLLSADRTFFKAAKNLIATDFPGHILHQLGDMIQNQLDNYSKYNLVSSTPLAQLWFQTLCVVWNEEPTAASYLMDVVLRCDFFRPDIAAMAYDNLAQLLQTLISTSQANSRLSSLFSWISGSSVMTLMPQGSSPHAPWFAYFSLHIEELHTQGTNGLWREIVKELAASTGKASVDNAIKKAAATLKLAVIPSSALSIYRWCQQILDTSVDHPALPLLWQRFFTLYFTRVVPPSGVDLGSVGEKFFEGLTNQVYQKKLKRKLSDCIEYFQAKAAVEGISSDKYLLYDTLAKLYDSFFLWLDEPRLHEPGLYLPALPPQYNPYKLSALTSSADQTPWFEYVDYEAVRLAQNNSIERWKKTQGRETIVQHPSRQNQEESDPVERINKRLKSYDSPVPPPPLRPSPPVVPPIHRDTLLHKNLMFDSLKPAFQSLLEYAQSYCLRVSEHTALDCSMLELLPVLYSNMETEITLHAACDTQDPRIKQTAHTLNCAGPAVIYIKVAPARKNEMIQRRIDFNQTDMDGLLKQSLLPPPMSMCVASVHIEHASKALEKECEELKKIGDIQLLTPVNEVGVALFYHMVNLYADDAVIYPPLKQLFTTCIETLGNIFISGVESQCVRLLTTVLQNPALSGVMAPHFTPSAASPLTFLQLYCTLVDSDQTSPDLLFVLLSKFDIGQWLLEKKPKLIERSQIIELTGKALTTAGLSPPEETLMLYGVFRHHLATLFMYDFPQHYGEILALCLRHSETQSLAPDVWYDLVNALTSAQLRPGLSLGQVKETIKKYATEQRSLSLLELQETASMLGGHFTKERLQYGLYGLYPKYRQYIEPLSHLLGVVGHTLVVSTLHCNLGTLSDKLCEQLWPHLVNLFSPWLVPYFTRHLPEPTAAWIQQLTDDRSVLPPWIVADGGHANKIIAMFVECVRFVMETLPAASSNMLSCVWQFYVTNFAHSCIKDHVLSVTHGNLISLAWHRFLPTVQDLDLMLKVVDQYLPDCHTFLGAVFIEVQWYQWVEHMAANLSPQECAKVHSALLHLLIKLANEPNVRQSPKVTPLLLEAQRFSWHLVECNAYESVTNWFVMSYDPRVVLQIPGEDWSNIDMAALDLLETAAGYSSKSEHFHATTPRKRQMYARACVKLLLSCLSRYKQFTSTRQSEIKATTRRLVDKVETLITATVPGPQRVSEAGLLLAEILTLVNQAANSPVTTLALEALLGWLNTRTAASVVVAALLRVLGITVANCEILGSLLEASLTAFFRRSGVSDSTQMSWSMAASSLQPIVPRHPPLEDSLVANGHLLSLYALTLKHMPSSLDVREEANLLNNLNQWLSVVKTSDLMEAKLPLLWSHALYLACRQCEFSSDPTAGPLTLRRLVQSVSHTVEHKSSWNILGAIGLGSNQSSSNRCRLLGRFIVAFVLAQMPERRYNNDSPTADQSLQFVRTKPHAPGAVATTNGDYIPSAEAVKAISSLETFSAEKNNQDLKTIAEFALQLVKQSQNSLQNSHQLVMDVARQLYTESFLHAHRSIDKISA